ncbi:MAG: recombination protein RecR [Rhodospirillales bacterium]|nr:recombination protein RecR [Alphaproteobacteria bacterium]MCB9986910.1 recombination protein RecR [Rhodospirillales bacterium]USO08313.1 MAG: recombination protein RecR [Rhodospirillales bacterium]
MTSPDINDLIRILARLPGVGPRSARRLALTLLEDREGMMKPLMLQMEKTYGNVRTCHTCGNLDASDPCMICAGPRRNHEIVCVVQGIADIWAIERTRAYDGVYHVLGGVLSAIDGIKPDDLRIAELLERVAAGGVGEIVLALSATVDGQTTAHYLTDRLTQMNVRITRLAHGMPVGGELDYLDDGTLTTALRSRTAVKNA